MSNKKITSTISMLTLFLLFTHQNCSQPGGTSTGNPLVSVDLAGFNPNAKVSSNVAPSITMCFKRLRFKTTSSATSASDFDLDLGEVQLNPSGTELATVGPPAGNYHRIEFDLDDRCGSGNSLQVTNTNGAFSTNEHITIRFDGDFALDASGGNLVLNIEAIVEALNDISNNMDVKDAAESVGGSF